MRAVGGGAPPIAGRSDALLRRRRAGSRQDWRD